LLHLTDAQVNINLRGASGIIFADIIGNRQQLEEALLSGTSCVVINNRVSDLEVDCISVDNLGGAVSAVEYLISLGHKRIAHISGDLITQAAQERLEGYKAALKKNGLPIDERYIFKTDYSRGHARQAAEKLLKNLEATAVFVASDSMALEVMAVARELGRHIPEDLSIVGFDDNPSGLYGPVALTTVRQPLIKMAQEGVKLLNQLMQHGKRPKVQRIVLPTELVVRESCRAPQQH
jgi:LacI family transcriptional regulator